MAVTRILLKKSGVKGKLPAAADAEYGELFLNYHSGDPMLCFKDNAGEIVQIKPARAIDGGAGETPPSTGNEEGDTIWDGTHLLVWDGTAWVPVGPNDLAYVTKTNGGTITNSAVSKMVRYPLTDNEYAAMVSWTYNLGQGALAESTLLRRLNMGEQPGIVIQQEFPRWVNAGGRKLQGLVNRRNDEIALALS